MPELNNNLFKQNRDYTRQESLQFILKYLRSRDSVITNISQIDCYNDYPKLYCYSTSYVSSSDRPSRKNDLKASGIAQGKKEAFLKAIAETVERWYLASCNRKNWTYASYLDLLKREKRVLKPSSIVGFTAEQLKSKKYRRFRVTEDTKLYWIKSYSLFEKDKPTYLPAELVYLFEFSNEMVLTRIPDSTGATVSFSLLSSIYKGMCEVVERDAFMNTYLNKWPVPPVQLDKIVEKKTQSLLDCLNRYRLNPIVFDITTDIKIPTFLCLLIDESGAGPCFTVGAKCDLDWQEAIYGSILESMQSLTSLRDMLNIKIQFGEKSRLYKAFLNNDVILKRLMFWIDKDPKKYLHFLFLKQPVAKKYRQKGLRLSTSEKFRQTCQILMARGFFVYWVPIKPDLRKKYNFHIVKVVIPELQPMSLHEDFPYYGGKRLRNLSYKLGYTERQILSERDFYSLPHPFP